LQSLQFDEEGHWSDWLHKSASHAYKKAGHLLHPDELAKGLSDPGGYITEHSGVDPMSIYADEPEEAGKKMALGIKEQEVRAADVVSSPKMKQHMDEVQWEGEMGL